MDLYKCSQDFNSDFLFEAENKFILYNVCDNYVIVNMTEQFLTTFKSNGISLTIFVMILSSFLIKVLDLITSRFILSDLLFTKKYFKLRELIFTVILVVPFIILNLVMPRKQVYSNIQVRSSKAIMTIALYCFIFPLGLFNFMRTRKGILFPMRVFNLTLFIIFFMNVVLDFYLNYTNRIDWFAVVFLLSSSVLYLISFFILIKMDISEQRNLIKKEGYKITHKYVTLEYELEELGSEAQKLTQSEEPDALSESELMSDSLGTSNSLAGSKVGTSQNFVGESALQIGASDVEAAAMKLHQKRDSLEDFMEAYELELDEKIRENQKQSVEDEFGKKLFFNQEEQREILRNKKITLWDKVFAEFSDLESKNRFDEIFENIFITVFALSLPSLKNPLMKTNWMPFIINNCVLLIILALRFLYNFTLSYAWFLPISISVTTLMMLLFHFKVYDFTVHRYICCFLTCFLGYILILDLGYVLTDIFTFFIFYFKVDILLVVGGMRAIRYIMPSFYLVMQLCKIQRHMIALLYTFMFSVGTYTIVISRSYISSIQSHTTRYNGFIQTVSLYNKKAPGLLFLGSYYVYFYIILMSFLMVIKKYKFDMSLIIMSLLLAVRC